MRQLTAKQGQTKARYHHGELREALIRATRKLVEDGVLEFYPCRRLPRGRRHHGGALPTFSGQAGHLAEIASRGFDEFRNRSWPWSPKKREGSLEGIDRLGQAYVAFAVEEIRRLSLKFGQEPSLKKAQHVLGTGQDCFVHVINQVALYQAQQSARRSPRIAEAVDVRARRRLRCIDQDYDAVAPGIDVNN